MSWDDLCSFSRTNFQVWRKAKSLPNSSHSRAVCREILKSAYRAHKQDMMGCPASGEPGNRVGGAREGLVLTAQEAGLVEAAAFTLHLLSKVHRFLADTTLLSSSPVWHPTEKAQAETASGWEVKQGTGRAGGRDGAERGSQSGHPPAVLQQPFRICTCGDHPQMFAVCTDSQLPGLVISRISRTQDAHGTHHYTTQQYQLPPRDHWSCEPGAAEIPLAWKPWDLTAPFCARKRQKAEQ